MSSIYDSIPVFIVAAVVSTLGWLFGGTRSDLIIQVVPWLLLFLGEVLFLQPQKGSGESTYDARERIWFSLKHDPLTWIVFGFLVLLAVPFMNNGLCVSCDRALIAQGLSADPPVKHLPFCVNRLQHLGVFLWFAVALLSMLATKHALRPHGRRLLVKCIVWNGFALAILGLVQTATGAQGPLWIPMANVKTTAGTFFSTFGYPNMAGDYFTTLFALALAVWRYSCEEVRENSLVDGKDAVKSAYHRFWRCHLYLIPAALFYFSAISTLSRAAIILVNVILLVVFVHSFLSFTHRMRRGDKVRRGTFALACIGLLAFFAVTSLPEDVQREVDTINANEVLTRVTGKGQYHTRVATAIWKDHFLFGCGGWGYKHFCVPKMTPEERKRIQMIGGINVHNDYLQFLAEHGLVGFGALVVIVGFVLAPVCRTWKRLANATRFMKAKNAPPKPTALFALPASAFIVLLSLLATFIHGFGDCPFRSAAVLTLFFVSLASITGYLPKKEEESNATR